MTENRDPRRLWQFQIRHLLGLMAAAAVILAFAAPHIRKLDTDAQLRAAGRTGVLRLVGLFILFRIISRRQTTERDAGPLLARFQRLRSRLLDYSILASLLLRYGLTVWADLERTRPSDYISPPGHPFLLYLAVNFIVVRFLWQISPQGLEVCENGLIVGGFNLHRWDEIARYSWTGTPRTQLNLFLNRRIVLNLKVNGRHADQLDSLLTARIGQGTSHAPAPH